MTDTILSNIENGVATITLNRPDVMNAFSPEMLKGLNEAITGANQNSGVQVIVLEGAGRCFSAGVDLRILQGITPVNGQIANEGFDAVAHLAAKTIRQSPIPVIAKVHGACFTGALEIALHCDIVYTIADAKFGDTHTKFGLRPSWGMSQTLPRAVGLRRAKELTFTARTFSGAEAAQWGLANEAVADKAALDALVAERAGQIAKNSPGSIRAHKDLYTMSADLLPLEEGLREELARTYPEITDTEKRLSGF